MQEIRDLATIRKIKDIEPCGQKRDIGLMREIDPHSLVPA